MNALTRGVQKNMVSKSYHRMQNDFDDSEQHASPQHQGRLRLGNRRSKKSISESSNDPNWADESRLEFSSGKNCMQRGEHVDSQTVLGSTCDESLISQGEASDVALRPTISKPAPQQYLRPQAHRHHAQNAGPATIISTTSLESMDRVEKPSITSPCMHNPQRNRIRMSKQRMLSEKTINTINTQGTMNTNATAGTGMQTVTTADSTLRSSIASIHSLNNSLVFGSTSEFTLVSSTDNSLPASSRLNRFSDNTPNVNVSLRALPLLKQENVSDAINSPCGVSPDSEETEEDRMMRLAMEMSLRDFEEFQKQELREACSHNNLTRVPSTPLGRLQQTSELLHSPSSCPRQAPESRTPSGRLRQTSEVSSPRPSYSQEKHASNGMHASSRTEEEELRRRLHTFYRQTSQQSLLTTATKEESVEVLVENRRGLQLNRRSSRMLVVLSEQEVSYPKSSSSAVAYGDSRNSTLCADPVLARQLEYARAHMPTEEADAIERALRGDPSLDGFSGEIATRSVPVVVPDHHQQIKHAWHLSPSEAAEIEKAIRDADIEEQEKFLTIAMKVPANASDFSKGSTQHKTNLSKGCVDRHGSSSPHRAADTDQSTFQQDWSSETDEEMLGLEADEDLALVGNTAYNAFRQSSDLQPCMNLSSNNIRRASEEMSTMEVCVRSEISRSISSGLIAHCNGIVKEGKDASVYHAAQGVESDGHDVAIKVFRRLEGSKIRSLMGDPRYFPRSSRSSLCCSDEELILRAEKEYRSLIRANRANVPVASPLLQRENLVFMRFIGEDGWPAPQLKEFELRKGSATWCLLYSQIMVAVRRLYVAARLVHGDLNEYNILVCNADLVENKHEQPGVADDGERYQAVLIDFVQAVDVNHPQANELLERDLEQISAFFFRKGIKTLGRKMAREFVTSPDPDGLERVERAGQCVVGGDVGKVPVSISELEKQVGNLESGTGVVCSKNANHSLGSNILGGEVVQKDILRTVSALSHSTKSSLSSGSSAQNGTSINTTAQSALPIVRTPNPVTEIASEHSRSSNKASKKKKEKKAHKEKKKKKESSSKKKIKDSQQEVDGLQNSLFETSFTPGSQDIFNYSLHEFEATFESNDIDWTANWGDE